jgi:hypothetical protein
MVHAGSSVTPKPAKGVATPILAEGWLVAKPPFPSSFFFQFFLLSF